MSTGSDDGPSQQFSQLFVSLLDNADDKTLREIIRYSSNLLNVRLTAGSDPNLLLSQFKVVPEVLNYYRAAQSTSTNRAGTLLAASSSPTSTTGTPAPDTSDFMKRLTLEVESMGLNQKSGTSNNRKVASQWIIKDPTHTNLPSEDMDKFPCISDLCTMLSGTYSGSDEFNSCIVNYYEDGTARTRAHADDESYIDQDYSICCFSIGSTRDIGIFEKKTGKMIGKHALEDGSLFVMSPGAQSNTKHQVLSTSQSGPRYSISFRRIKYTQVKNEWPFTNKTAKSGSSVSNASSVNNVSSRTTLVLGTSIPYRLDYSKLAGSSGKFRVINLCKGGAKINTVQDMLDEHYTNASSGENASVDKVIISVGTNDLRNHKKPTVGHLYTPMENLIAKIKTYYPGATIYVQSLLPQRVQNAYTVSNVLGFNKLLVKLCAMNRCYYLDIFDQFLGDNKHPHPALYRWDGVHLSSKGLSALARAFISKIRGRFNPFTGV